jgi:hypothetical protein
MTANSVDEHGALTNKKFPRTMQDKDSLPFRALDRHKPHRRTASRHERQASTNVLKVDPTGDAAF